MFKRQHPELMPGERLIEIPGLTFIYHGRRLVYVADEHGNYPRIYRFRFFLLEALAEHPGFVLTHEELATRIYEEHGLAMPKQWQTGPLPQLRDNLRSILGRDPITTIHKRGYRLEAD